MHSAAVAVHGTPVQICCLNDVSLILASRLVGDTGDGFLSALAAIDRLDIDSLRSRATDGVDPIIIYKRAMHIS